MKEHRKTFNLIESIQFNLEEARRNPEINKDNKNKDTGVEYDTSKEDSKRNKVSKTKSQTWEVNPNRRSRIYKDLKDEEPSDLNDKLKNIVKKSMEESISLDEGMSIDEAIKELVAGGELYFRDNDNSKPYIAVYADNYPEPEEYDEGFKIENGGNEEQLAKVKQAADEGDVWEFRQVDEKTLEPNGEDSFLAYGEDDLRETLQYLHQVNIIKSLEEDDSVEAVDEQLDMDDFINELANFLKTKGATDVYSSNTPSNNILRVISFKLNNKNYDLELIER